MTNRKIRNFQAQKNRFPRKTFKSKNTVFRCQRPNAFLTDRWHGGFEFFAHRPCSATQGSTFRARSARRVREKAPRAGCGSQSAPKIRTMELWSSRKSEFLILVGRAHPIRSRGLRIGAPFGWIDFRAIHNNGQCFKCAKSCIFDCAL